MAARVVSHTKLEPGVTGNLWLDSLSGESAAAFLPLLERVTLEVGAPVGSTGSLSEYVLFPIDCVVSTVTVMRDGMSVEVTLVGREGFYGVHLVLGVATSPAEAMIQLPGTSLRTRSADFVAAMRDPALVERALRYAQATLVTVSQFSACNRLHPITERCARWLLMAHDRVAGDELFLTHEYLATMLGVRRPSVSVAAGALDAVRFIEYHRGRIVIRDRAGLETAACECYEIVNEETKRLLNYDPRKSSRAAKLISSDPSGKRPTE